MRNEVNVPRALLVLFKELCAAKNITYYPSVPWDEKNLEEILHFYDEELVKTLIQEYVKYDSDPTIRYFCNNIQSLARAHRVNKQQDEEFKDLVRKTKQRMDNNQ